MVVGARRAGVSIQKLLIYWDFHAQLSPGFTDNVVYIFFIYKKGNIQ